MCFYFPRNRSFLFFPKVKKMEVFFLFSYFPSRSKPTLQECGVQLWYFKTKLFWNLEDFIVATPLKINFIFSIKMHLRLQFLFIKPRFLSATIHIYLPKHSDKESQSYLHLYSSFYSYYIWSKFLGSNKPVSFLSRILSFHSQNSCDW